MTLTIEKLFLNPTERQDGKGEYIRVVLKGVDENNQSTSIRYNIGITDKEIGVKLKELLKINATITVDCELNDKHQNKNGEKVSYFEPTTNGKKQLQEMGLLNEYDILSVFK